MSILALTSDTLTSPAAAGQIEYASPIFVATPVGTQRGIVPTQQYYRLDSAYAGSNATGAQSLFGVGVTLSASTVYEFEALIMLYKTAGTTSHDVSLGFGGTATVNNILYDGSSARMNALNTAVSTAVTPMTSFAGSQATATVAQSAITSATTAFIFKIRGSVSINAGGTFIPQYTLSAAPGGAYSTYAGSFIRINPLSASGAATNVGTWA
tara:strand:- start:2682 stop:3314 length:633 start_codon:yes stop_codon:yes gene_type:complete